MLDANDSMSGRWQRIRQVSLPYYPNLPEIIPSDGLVHDHPGMPRLGAWIMPDNSTEGMLESFLRYLIPASARELWSYAGKSTAEARRHGAVYRDVHQEKAAIHAWLAWADPPGQPFGQALKSRCLDPRSPAAIPFANWFIRLFQLEGIRL
jgi:hypothetical protein